MTPPNIDVTTYGALLTRAFRSGQRIGNGIFPRGAANMPKLTASRGGVNIDDGTYGATVLGIEEASPTPNSPAGDKPWLKWTFSVDDGSTEGVEMTAASSLKFGPKSKARLWAEALLGRKLDTGEEFDTDSLLPRDCIVVIRRDEKDFAKITDVLPLPKEKPAKATKAALTSAATASHNDEDGIPL
jgi:hypothetical protein